MNIQVVTKARGLIRDAEGESTEKNVEDRILRKLHSRTKV